MNTLQVRMKPYIQPFERVLALRELQILGGVQPRPLGLLEETSLDFEIASPCTQAELVKRLAYWEAVAQERSLVITDQCLRESTMNLVRGDIAIKTLQQQLPFQTNIPLPNRRCLRYATHGIHEYRGKFFPQLVRSLINISGISPGNIVADPMSGSGTTIVEALLAGCQGWGLDMNPLSVFIGNTKTRLLSADPGNLTAGYEQIRYELLDGCLKPKHGDYLKNLPAADRDYLAGWFSSEVLTVIDEVSCAIQRVTDEGVRDLMRVALSNILRRISWQKDDDLRVRKQIRSDVEIDAKKEFLEELGRSIRVVLSFLFQNGKISDPQFRIMEGDARNCAEAWGEKTVDVVITSPPYATALPYLDTDRLSLCYLGLLPRSDHRIRDQKMIGNREISERLRKSYWMRFKIHGTMLPQSVQDLIHRIDGLNIKSDVGFRRKNLPALLANYFFDMRDVLQGIHRVLKPGNLAFVVVGNNHTIAGGQRVDIQTAKLLQNIAETVGLEVMEAISMDMLISRDIFRKNAMSSEEILIFRRPVFS